MESSGEIETTGEKIKLFAVEGLEPNAVIGWIEGDRRLLLLSSEKAKEWDETLRIAQRNNALKQRPISPAQVMIGVIRFVDESRGVAYCADGLEKGIRVSWFPGAQAAIQRNEFTNWVEYFDDPDKEVRSFSEFSERHNMYVYEFRIWAREAEEFYEILGR